MLSDHSDEARVLACDFGQCAGGGGRGGVRGACVWGVSGQEDP